ncbi:MAG: DHHW family protein [Bacteroides sp.]|nr:DHHW family protein [Eubacterium sp.]MCM1418508.1 DHHW family protein [Roseburia sp.]MCM1462527.1 DHHW family protein [Bacteroides sp.]
MEKKKKPKKETTKPLRPIFAIGNIVYTSIFFGLTAVALLVLPRSEQSQIEKRDLAEFPEFTWEDFLNGNYTAGIAEYYDDTVPYRDSLKNAAVVIKSAYGVPLDDTEIHGQLVAVTEPPVVTAPRPKETTSASTTSSAKESAPALSEDAPVTTTAPPVTTTTPATTSARQVNEIAEGVITNGQVVTKLADGHYRGISLFGGGAGTVYAETLNRLHAELGDEVTVYSMVVPTAGEYYLPDKYDAYNASHAAFIDKINAQLDPAVVPVDAVTALAAHTDEEIYTRTDHHWQPLGAYYAVEAFTAAAGVPFAPLERYERVVVDGYIGTMYTYTESALILNDPEQFVYYKPSNDYTTYYYDTAYNFDYEFPLFVAQPVESSYSTFMGGDRKIVRIETDVKNGRKLLIFKDSYGNAEIPFLTSSFEEIYVCDMRWFDLNPAEFIKEQGITDLLATMCSFSATGPNAESFAAKLDNPTRAGNTTVAPEGETS